MTKGEIISFDGSIYLGLLTELPNDNGTMKENGSYYSEPVDPSYCRIRIDTKNRINGKDFISEATVDEVILNDNGDEVAPVYVTNQGLIMFTESSVTWDKPIVGFGLFRNENVNSETLPFLWGEVQSAEGETGIVVEKHEVPVIRPGCFKITLM